jgi:hypothetical protein
MGRGCLNHSRPTFYSGERKMTEEQKEKERQRYRKNRKKVLLRQHKYYLKNSEKIKAYQKQHRLNKPISVRRLYERRKGVKTLYNLTPEQHDSFLRKQNFTCPITSLPVNIFSTIDHDHSCCSGRRSCGKCVRGIIYGKVNSALGAFSNPIWLLKAYEYVTK